MKYLNRFLKTTLIILIGYFIYYQIYVHSFYNGPIEIINYNEYSRIPLIEPYSIYSHSENQDKDWYTLFEADSMKFEISDYSNFNSFGNLRYIDSIGISKKFVVFYCFDYDSIFGRQEWFIFNIETKLGRGFVNFSDYQQQLKKAGYQKIQMYNPNVIYRTFEKTSTLPIEWKELQRNEKRKYWWIIKYWFE